MPPHEFIVKVDPIKEQIQAVKKQLHELHQKDPSKKDQVEHQLRVLKQVWDDLGNLEF